MSLLLLILRWIGAFVIAFIVFFTVITVVTVTLPGLVLSVHGLAILTFLGIVPSFALSSLVVPSEQRKAFVLVLWMLAAAFYVRPLLAGDFGMESFLVLGAVGIGGGIVYCLTRTGLFGGRKFNRVPSESV